MSHAPSRAYAETAAPKPTPADVFALATERFMAGVKLDARALAVELGVPRATLYRWIGDRERLLADVMWAQLEAVIDASLHRSRTRGARHILAGISALLETIAAAEPLRAFLDHEGARGLALITSPDGGVHPRLVARLVAVIEQEAAAGHYAPPATPSELAEGILSVGEHFLYAGLINGFRPDAAAATRLARLMLRED